jgi:hypothetical protein
MQAVFDSVSIQHLLRSLKLFKISKKKEYYEIFETPLDRPLQEGRLALAVDEAGGLVDQWGRTCGEEYIRVLITRWESFAALITTNPISKIQPSISSSLRQLGFVDGIDRLVLRIGMATTDRIVVSDDPDFWDPARPDKRGDSNAPVAKFCRERLCITVLLLAMLLKVV